VPCHTQVWCSHEFRSRQTQRVSNKQGCEQPLQNGNSVRTLLGRRKSHTSPISIRGVNIGRPCVKQEPAARACMAMTASMTELTESIGDKLRLHPPAHTPLPPRSLDATPGRRHRRQSRRPPSSRKIKFIARLTRCLWPNQRIQLRCSMKFLAGSTSKLCSTGTSGFVASSCS
jgi:hypothetical protein